MPDKAKKPSSRRGAFARQFIGLNGPEEASPFKLNLLRILAGFGISLAVAALLVNFEFQSVPEYRVGDIADRTIEAPIDFTVVDSAATEKRRADVLGRVPVIFDFDLRVNLRLVSEFRGAFQQAREVIARERTRLGIAEGASLGRRGLREVRPLLEDLLPRFSQRQVLDICLRYSFSEELENQLALLLSRAIKYPGVIPSREVLLSYADRGITIHNLGTQQTETLSDLMAIRDIGQARDLLRQYEVELTIVAGEEKRVLISFLDTWITGNVYFNESETRRAEERALASVDPVLLQAKKGKTIVRSGDELQEEQVAQLLELRKLKQPGRFLRQFVSAIVVAWFFLTVLWLYFRLHHVEKERRPADFALVTVVLLLSLLVVRVALGLGELVWDSLKMPLAQSLSDFHLVAPFALGAMLITLLLGTDLAVFFSLMFAVFVGLQSGELEVAIVCLSGSLAAVYSLGNYRERVALLRSGLAVGLVTVGMALALQLFDTSSSFHWASFVTRSAAGILGSAFSVMLATLLLPLMESAFGRITDIRLLELSNLNSPVLRRLAVEAPGTYHHSIIVGTLGESAAEAIGANPLLVRVGAYYHDIGKLKHPEYYVENQVYGINKHETLTPTMSSLILASHVKDGLAIAREVGLAPAVSDLIPQHHGTRLMTFFYHKAKEAAEQRNHTVNEGDFRYPGPRPQSKEAAILMLADQVEAAARTLQDPNPVQFRSMIRRLVHSTIQDGQFDECDITMKELELVAQAFERVLTGIYHQRIQYPGFEFGKQEIDAKRVDSQRIQ